MYLHKPCLNNARNIPGFSLGNGAVNVAVSNSWQPDVKCLSLHYVKEATSV